MGFVDYDQARTPAFVDGLQGARDGGAGDSGEGRRLLVSIEDLSADGLREVPPDGALKLGDKLLGVGDDQNVVGGPLKQMSVDHLAGEDRQAIAKQCGTSVEMLERNYSFAIEDLEDQGPKPAVEERVRARTLAPAGRCRQLRAA